MAERGFIEVLRDLNEGDTVTEADAALAKLMGEIRESGKGGSLTLILEFKPTGKGRQIEIKDGIKVKPPKAASGTTVLFVNDKNELVRKDPRQPDLPNLRKVTAIDRKSEGANAD